MNLRVAPYIPPRRRHRTIADQGRDYEHSAYGRDASSRGGSSQAGGLHLQEGTLPKITPTIADLLMDTELRGGVSHGVRQMERYVRLYQEGKINSDPGGMTIYLDHPPILSTYSVLHSGAQPTPTDDLQSVGAERSYSLRKLL